MKKVFAILCAFLALVSCTNLSPIAEENTKDNDKINFNISVSRTDIDGNTKANIKNSWAEGDVVYLFLCGGISPKYIEMKYTSGSWVSQAKNGLTASDITALYGNWKSLVAIYLPYGSDRTVYVASGTTQTTYGLTPTYSGNFYTQKKKYDWDSSTSTFSVSLSLSLSDTDNGAAIPGKLVHFDVTGLTPGHEYTLQQEYMKTISYNRTVSSGSIYVNLGANSSLLKGYYDNNKTVSTDDDFFSFSGVLDASVDGVETDYTFTLRDHTANKVYVREIKKKTISNNMYIGLGNISKWAEVTPPTDPVFSVALNTTALIAPANLVYVKGTWKFHDQAYDCCFKKSEHEEATEYYKETEGTFDLFGWGTSGWNGYGETRTGYQPWSWSVNDYVFGPDPTTEAGLINLTGDFANGDWGVYNAIKNGSSTDPAGYWITPSITQWSYLLTTRPASTLNGTINARFAKARIEVETGVYQNGLIIFPDYYNHPDDVALPSGINTGSAPYSTNTYTPDEWDKIAAKGAAFLPASGARAIMTEDTDPKPEYNSTYNNQGRYWSSTAASNTAPKESGSMMQVSESGLSITSNRRRAGAAVRLIHIITE